MTVVCTSALVVLVLCTLIPGVAAALPNFVLMMSDDTGWGDMGYNNGTADTPHLDAWATAPSAIKFERFYAGAPVCSPTRASFLTGRTPWRDCIFNVEYIALSFTENEHFTVASAAQTKGYRTAHFGKWHLGSLDTPPPPKPAEGSCGRGPPGTWCGPHDGTLPVASPLDFGFDTFCSTPQCGPSASANCVCAQAAAPGVFPGSATLKTCNTGHYHGDPDQMVFPCQQYYYSTPAMNKTIAAFPAASKDDDNEHLMDQFVLFMNSAIAESKPFLGVIWFHSVHIPYVAPDAFRGRYAAKYDENQADYYGALTAMDGQIGRLRSLLRTMGIADNTVLVYTADNGPEGQSYHPVSPHSPNGNNPGETNGLRGRKRDLAEGGIRVPGLLEWPAMITNNMHTYHPAGTVDLKPTVMDIIGILPPADWPLDGTSLLPLIKGLVVNRTKPMGFVWGMVFGNNNHTGVCGSWLDEQHVLANASAESMLTEHSHWDTTPEGSNNNILRASDRVNQAAWMEQDYKLFGCNNLNGFPLQYFLYDLRSDPGERHDLASTMPEKVAEMKASLSEWISSVAVSRGPKETNCAAAVPLGPYTPSPYLTNCTFTQGKTMPGSMPIKQPAASEEACCSVCFATTWCVAAIYQANEKSCNMHYTKDLHPLEQGADVSVVTGRAYSANYSASANSATKHGKGGAGEGTTRVIYKTGSSSSSKCKETMKMKKGKGKGKRNKRDRGRGGRADEDEDDDSGDGTAAAAAAASGAAPPLVLLPSVEILCIEKEMEKIINACVNNATNIGVDDDLTSIVAGPLVVYRPRGLRKGNRATNAELEAIFSTHDIEYCISVILKAHITKAVAAAKAPPKGPKAWAAAGNLQWAGSGLSILHQKYWSWQSHRWMSAQRKECVFTCLLSAIRIENNSIVADGAAAAVVAAATPAHGAGWEDIDLPSPGAIEGVGPPTSSAPLQSSVVDTAAGCAALLGIDRLEGLNAKQLKRAYRVKAHSVIPDRLDADGKVWLQQLERAYAEALRRLPLQRARDRDRLERGVAVAPSSPLPVEIWMKILTFVPRVLLGPTSHPENFSGRAREHLKSV